MGGDVGAAAAASSELFGLDGSLPRRPFSESLRTTKTQTLIV